MNRYMKAALIGGCVATVWAFFLKSFFIAPGVFSGPHPLPIESVIVIWLFVAALLSGLFSAIELQVARHETSFKRIGKG